MGERHKSENDMSPKAQYAKFGIGYVILRSSYNKIRDHFLIPKSGRGLIHQHDEYKAVV